MLEVKDHHLLIGQSQKGEVALPLREALLERCQDEAQVKESRPAAQVRQKEELAGLEQRIRNARRRLYALAEEYERLREKLVKVAAGLPQTQTTPYPADQKHPAELDHQPGGTANNPSFPSRLQLRLAEPAALLQKLVGDLLDRATELHELADRFNTIRQCWLEEFSKAVEELRQGTANLQQWQSELERRQARLEQDEAELSRRHQEQLEREMRLRAEETRLATHQRAWQLAFDQIKLRWKTAAQALRQRELYLQSLIAEWQSRLQSLCHRWQVTHQRTTEMAQRYAQLHQRYQEKVAELESGRLHLWQKQQALEAAIQTWTMQTPDAFEAERHLKQWRQRLRQHLASWERRLQLRERQLAVESNALAQLASQLHARDSEIRAGAEQLFSIAQQLRNYLHWANRQHHSTASLIAEAERDHLRQTNLELLTAIENLASCLLQPVDRSERLTRAA